MSDTQTVRVMTWNLWWRFGPWQERIPAIAQTLARENADIICLQEVWDDGKRNFAAELAEGLGYHWVYAPAARPNGLHLGNAVLSRWPISGHEITRLHDEKGAEELRVVLHASIAAPFAPLPVFCTHLNYKPFHSHIRQRQVKDVLAVIDRARPWRFPPILCGDFNAEPMSDEIRMITGLTTSPVPGLALLDAWAVCHPDKLGFTWNTENPFVAETHEPNRRIDYIFAGLPTHSGAGQFLDCRIAGNLPIDGTWPSDHFALVAELRT